MDDITIKLQKAIADTGYASRRKAEELIKARKVRVNGKVADIGVRVGPDDKIKVDGEVLARTVVNKERLIIYNKPAGEVCTRDDPEGRPTVFEGLPNLRNGRWIIVGRLDYHTQGLLLFTTDGHLANTLMHPKNEYEREYKVRIMGGLSDEEISVMRSGVQLEDGPARFDKIIAQGDHGGKNQWLQVIVRQGRNRVVRRIFESQDITVSRLIRIRFGQYKLPRDLKTGEFREVDFQ